MAGATPIPPSIRCRARWRFVNLAPTTLGLDPQGVLGGVQAGYNWQAGKFVFGLEADIQASDIHGNAVLTPIIQNNGTPFPGAGFLAASQRIDWFGTVRARAGFTPVDRLLLYVTGGLAYGDVSYSSAIRFQAGRDIQPIRQRSAAPRLAGPPAPAPSGRSRRTGRRRSSTSISTSATNRRLPIRSPANPPFQVGYTWKTTDHIARVGLNYKFGWGGPVVAKY